MRPSRQAMGSWMVGIKGRVGHVGMGWPAALDGVEERAVAVGGGMQARREEEWGGERNQGVLGDETWMIETVQQRLML